MSIFEMLELRRLRSGFLGGLVDQAVVSVGNFGLNILLARNFAEHEYGVFSLVLSFALFLNTLQQAFITYPLSVQGAPVTGERFDYFLTVAVLLTLAGTVLALPVMVAATWSAHKLVLLPVVSLFLLSWQLQEVYRRGLLAHARNAAAAINDFVRYICPLAILLGVAHFFTLSLDTVFLLLAASSLLTCWRLVPHVVGQFRGVLGNARSELRSHWLMAAPVLGANLLAVFSTQWFLWLLAWGRDLSSSAALVALSNIVAFASPVMYGMENILVPEIARRRDHLNFDGLMALLKRRGIICAVLVLPMFLAIAVWPGPALHLFYGHHKFYTQYTLALRLLAGAYVTYLASYIFGAALRGYRETRAVLRMQLYPALFGVTFGSLLTLRFGVTGACFSALVAGSLRACIGYYFVNRLRDATTQFSATSTLKVTL